MTIPAGQRNQLVQILRATSTVDALGQPVHTWAVLCQAWARARPSRSYEGQQAGAIAAPGQVVFGINWRGDITPAMRVRWRGRDYAIEGDPVDVAGARETLEITCKGIAP